MRFPPSSRDIAAACALLGMISVWGCHGKATGGAQRSTALSRASIRFTEVSERAGIHFAHTNGASGDKRMPETMGSGVAFLDYDNDGWQDLFFVNSAPWPGAREKPSPSRLYHNRGDGTFEDVTDGSGLDSPVYGMGAAVADFDNDGYTDIYLTALGPNRLFRNRLGDHPNGGPIFEDITARAGVAGMHVPHPSVGLEWKWSSSAAWLDYNRDGLLDLFVCNYVQWSPQLHRACLNGAVKTYCPPHQYEGLYSTLFRNEGGGRFRDVSAETGLQAPGCAGKSLGVAVADFNADGWPDIAIANDTTPNFLFINQAGRRFEERGAEMGIALGDTGQAKAGMGIDAADWRNDGRKAIAIGNFAAESLSLFQMEDAGLFTNRAQEAGLAVPSLEFLTFGLFFFDGDLDGWQDLFTANGHIDDHVELRSTAFSYRQRPQLYRNLGTGVFEEIGVAAGLTERLVARGAAYGDIDNDGDLDIALNCNGGKARLFRNDGTGPGNWLRISLRGAVSNRQGLGSVVRVTAGGVTQTQDVRSGGSYLSESQRELTFGLAQARKVDEVSVTWPSGKSHRWTDAAANRAYTATEEGELLPSQR